MDIQVICSQTIGNLAKLCGHTLKHASSPPSVTLLVDRRSGSLETPRPIGEFAERLGGEGGSGQLCVSLVILIQRDKVGVLHCFPESREWAALLEKRAKEVMEETLWAVNQVAVRLPGTSFRDLLLECVQSVKLDLSPDDLIAHAGWQGAVGRSAAENLLKGAPPGVYLLRMGDPYTRTLEKNLRAGGIRQVRCYVLTLAEGYGKISDKVLIQAPGGWAVFNDDLEMSDYRFKPLPQTLIEAGAATPLKPFKKAG